MAKKILLASGCSYTDRNYRSNDPNVDPSWPKWPQIFADHLGLQCVNYGKSGRGSDHIFDSIIEGIETYGDRIDTVAVLWTGSDRIPFFNFTLSPFVEIQLPWADPNISHLNPLKWQEDIGVGSVSKKYLQSVHFMRAEVYKTMITSPLKKMSTVIKLCKYHDIKLVMGQGLIYFDYFAINRAISRDKIPSSCSINFQEVFTFFSKNPFFAHIEKNKKHVIGWPFFRNLSGHSFDDLRLHNPKYFISDIDRHPSKLGQELFAREFIKRYDELYSI